MTPKETRNQLLAQRLIKQLERRHYEAYYCKTRTDILNKVRELMPEESTVTWGGSMTIRDSGVTRMLKESNYRVYDRDEVTTPEEKDQIYRKAFECDFYLSSVNAMSEDGIIVNIDRNGNRVAALTWGPRRVILIVGLNKVCQDLDAAVKRARSTAAPINMARFGLKTPCQTDGTCHNCLSPDSICCYVGIQRMSFPPRRHIVLLTDEELGY